MSPARGLMPSARFRARQCVRGFSKTNRVLEQARSLDKKPCPCKIKYTLVYTGLIMDKYLSRIAEKKFFRMNESFPVVLVTGARQVGKTTMLEYLAKGQNRTYVTLDDLNIRNMAINDPVSFFQNHKTPVIIDEIQYAPNLFSQIKIMCDKNKTPGEFWLTGSQSYNLMKGVSESLAGRVGIMEMSSFTMDEFTGDIKEPLNNFNIDCLKSRFKNCVKYSNEELFEFIYRGGMPKTFGFSEEMRKDYFNAYIHSYLMRDIMELGKISDLIRFNRFLIACAAMISGQLNIATLANAADISQPTAKEWLNVLQGLGIVYLLRAYFNNEIKRLVKSPKLYFYDTGLAAYLSLWPSSETLKVGNMNGAYFENFVVNQIVKKFSYTSQPPNVFYYRDVDQKEIDLILETHEGLTPLEIKMTSNPHTGDIAKFAVLNKFKKNVLPGAIFCMIDKPLLIEGDNVFLPVCLL